MPLIVCVCVCVYTYVCTCVVRMKSPATCNKMKINHSALITEKLHEICISSICVRIHEFQFKNSLPVVVCLNIVYVFQRQPVAGSVSFSLSLSHEQTLRKRGGNDKVTLLFPTPVCLSVCLSACPSDGIFSACFGKLKAAAAHSIDRYVPTTAAPQTVAPAALALSQYCVVEIDLYY